VPRAAAEVTPCASPGIESSWPGRRRAAPTAGLPATRGGYAHVVMAVDREANVDGLWVSLAFEVAPPVRPAAVLARLEVDLPDGSALIAIDLTGPSGGEGGPRAPSRRDPGGRERSNA
jgi:hypothetical protein